MGCLFCCDSGGTTLGGLNLGVAMLSIPSSSLINTVWESPSVINGLGGAVLRKK